MCFTREQASENTWPYYAASAAAAGDADVARPKGRMHLLAIGSSAHHPYTGLTMFTAAGILCDKLGDEIWLEGVVTAVPYYVGMDCAIVPLDVEVTTEARLMGFVVHPRRFLQKCFDKIGADATTYVRDMMGDARQLLEADEHVCEMILAAEDALRDVPLLPTPDAYNAREHAFGDDSMAWAEDLLIKAGFGAKTPSIKMLNDMYKARELFGRNSNSTCATNDEPKIVAATAMVARIVLNLCPATATTSRNIFHLLPRDAAAVRAIVDASVAAAEAEAAAEAAAAAPQAKKRSVRAAATIAVVTTFPPLPLADAKSPSIIILDEMGAVLDARMAATPPADTPFARSAGVAVDALLATSTMTIGLARRLIFEARAAALVLGVWYAVVGASRIIKPSHQELQKIAMPWFKHVVSEQRRTMIARWLVEKTNRQIGFFGNGELLLELRSRSRALLARKVCALMRAQQPYPDVLTPAEERKFGAPAPTPADGVVVLAPRRSTRVNDDALGKSRDNGDEDENDIRDMLCTDVTLELPPKVKGVTIAQQAAAVSQRTAGRAAVAIKKSKGRTPRARTPKAPPPSLVPQAAKAAKRKLTVPEAIRSPAPAALAASAPAPAPTAARPMPFPFGARGLGGVSLAAAPPLPRSASAVVYPAFAAAPAPEPPSAPPSAVLRYVLLPELLKVEARKPALATMVRVLRENALAQPSNEELHERMYESLLQAYATVEQ